MRLIVARSQSTEGPMVGVDDGIGVGVGVGVIMTPLASDAVRRSPLEYRAALRGYRGVARACPTNCTPTKRSRSGRFRIKEDLYCYGLLVVWRLAWRLAWLLLG